MIAMTTSSSIKVKPRVARDVGREVMQGDSFMDNMGSGGHVLVLKSLSINPVETDIDPEERLAGDRARDHGRWRSASLGEESAPFASLEDDKNVNELLARLQSASAPASFFGRLLYFLC
jgi:hypothetical protein